MDEYTKQLNEAIQANNLDAAKEAIKAGASVNWNNSPRGSFLHIAVHKGRTKIIKLLLENGANCNADNAKGFCPLERATRENNIEIVKLLLAKGADPNILNKEKRSPLFVSTYRNYDEISKLLLENGADPHFYSQVCKKSILYNAIDKGNTAITSLLLKKGVNPNEIIPSGDLPLILATRKGYAEIVSELLKYGADVNARNSSNYTALQSAFANLNAEIIIILIAAGASIYTRLNGGDIAFDELKEPHIQKLLSDRIKEILSSGEDPNKEKLNTNLINSEIISKFLSKVNEALGIESYLEHKFEDIITSIPEPTQIQQLIDAISRGDLETVQQLLSTGMKVNSMTEDREIPLIKATEKNNIAIVELLLKNGADPNFRDVLSPLPLEIVIESDDYELVKLLLENGADPNEYTCDELFPLHVAINKGNIRILEKLLQFGANINYKNDWGDTALNLAFNDQNPEIIILLIANGADTNIKIEGNKSALDALQTEENRKLLNEYIKKLLSINILKLNSKEDFANTISKLIAVKKFSEKTGNVFNDPKVINKINNILKNLELPISSDELKRMDFKENLELLQETETNLFGDHLNTEEAA